MSQKSNTPTDEAPPEPTERPERLEAPDDSADGLNWRLVVGVLVSATILGYLVVDGLGSETYFFTVDEAVAEGSALTGQTIRVKGNVVDGSIEGADGEIGRTFEISEKGKTIEVTYDKAMPDTFKEGVQVVATGKIASSGTLKADKILVKCPSRYEGKPPTAHEGGEAPQANR